MGKITLRRYTNLAATIHILKSRAITLLSPTLWDDRNDAFFMSQYKERMAAKSVLALCFAEASETYHHWKVFSQGSDGTCIEFDKDKLLSSLISHSKISSDSVSYQTIIDMKKLTLDVGRLPFFKRYPYQDEKEFRIVYTDLEHSNEAKEFAISLHAITRISLSPWLPSALSKSVVSSLQSIDGCSHLKISRSTLIENENWKALAKKAIT